MPNTTAPSPRRANGAYRWVRQLHLWVGAWGALAAILFGVTGLVMNHRFGDAAWPQGESQESARLTLEVPVEARATKETMKAWLGSEHRLQVSNVRAGKPESGRLGGREVKQPPKWTLSGGSARRSWTVEYVPGNATAELKRSEHSPLASVLRLHKGVGGGLAWRLLQDSFAIGMVLLGLSGIWMWARGRDLRSMVVSVFGLGVLVFAAVVGTALA